MIRETDTTDVLVIIPAHNEESTVGEVVHETLKLGFPTCVVDDGSSDATAAVARRAGACVRSHSTRLGRGRALRSGFEYATRQGYRCVVTIDGDGQHDVQDVTSLLECLHNTGSHLVIGSRFTHAAGTYRIGSLRRLAMNMVTARVCAVTRAGFTDATSGFGVVRRPLLDQFAEFYPTTFLSDTAEALARAHAAGWLISEIPVRMTHRRVGRSRTGPLSSLWYLAVVLIRIENLRWSGSRAHFRRATRAVPAPGCGPG